MEKANFDFLKNISGNPESDRQYINKFFSFVYSEKYLMSLASKVQSRELVLQKLRESKRCASMKGIFYL